jgi:hypothetical protein
MELFNTARLNQSTQSSACLKRWCMRSNNEDTLIFFRRTMNYQIHCMITRPILAVIGILISLYAADTRSSILSASSFFSV